MVSMTEVGRVIIPLMPDGFTLQVDDVTDSLMMQFGGWEWLLLTRREFEDGSWKAEFEKRIENAIKEFWGFEDLPEEPE